MNNKKFHPMYGIVSLLISIILPTLIFNAYQQLTTLCDGIVPYAIVTAMITIWLASLFVALRELGGLMIHQVGHT